MALQLNLVGPAQLQVKVPQRTQVDLTGRGRLQSAIRTIDAHSLNTRRYSTKLLELADGEQAIVDQRHAGRRRLVAVGGVVRGQQGVERKVMDRTPVGSIDRSRKRVLDGSVTVEIVLEDCSSSGPRYDDGHRQRIGRAHV